MQSMLYTSLFAIYVYIDVYWFSGHGDVYQHAVLHNFVSHLFIYQSFKYFISFASVHQIAVFPSSALICLVSLTMLILVATIIIT